MPATNLVTKAKVFAQIGFDAQKCDINCGFCSFAKDSFYGASQIKSLDDTLTEVKNVIESGIEELFLMTTANYSQEQFLEYGATVRVIMPKDMPFVANVGDFDLAYAKRLKKIGFTGVYHICRLGEGTNTASTEAARIRTLDAVKDEGLALYYRVEPIGPEHTAQQLVTEMLRAREYPVGVMAVMKRIAVPGTPLAEKGEISCTMLAKICAVATLTVRPQKAIGVHEPDELCLMAGANQIYAECGSNPRDLAFETKNGRGFSVADAIAILRKAEGE